MRRQRILIAVAAALIAAALLLSSCGGDDDDDGTTGAGATTTTAPSSGLSPPSGSATPRGVSQLPPTLVQCFADAGFDVQAATDIHSAPPQVVQRCFEALHSGAGAP